MKRIPISDAKSGMILAQDIFMSEWNIAAMLCRNTVLTPALIRLMREKYTGFVQVEDHVHYSKNETGGSEVSTAEFPMPCPSPVIGSRLWDETMLVVKDVITFISANSRGKYAPLGIIQNLDRVVGQLVDSLLENQGVLINICGLKHYDEYTYNHSLSTAILSVAIGQYCGCGREELTNIAKAALLHDIGKTTIPVKIIQKESRLNIREYAIVKRHPRAGYDSLMTARLCCEEVCEAVLYHHERINGSGYPSKLRGTDIPFFSRIIAVADVYDALTSKRPYRIPVQPPDALEYIMGGAGRDFDFDIVETFVKKLEIYPVGSLIELSDGRIAEVLCTHYPTRPVVRLTTGETLDLLYDKSCLGIVVKRLLIG